MYSKLGLAAFASVVFVRLVAAQQPTWAQCGGIGWTGATTCVSGTVCTKLNDYFSQCIPGANPAPTSSTSSTPAGPTSGPPGVDKANFWFSFGDSYTQTGFSPSGDVPVPGNPLGNPPFPGWTAVGGTNWIDLNTVEYNKSFILTYNYAYGGATIDASLVKPYDPSVLSLIDQVNQFMNQTANKPAFAPWTSSNALFSVWIGINDLGNSYYLGGDRGAFANVLMDAYFGQVRKLHDVGARNFLFINVPPVDRSPLMLAQSADAQALEKTVIADYNSKLAARAAAFQAAYSEVKFWLWDSNTAFTTILDNPTKFGFADATSFGNPTSFWGNNYHPSSAAHTIFAQKVASVLADSVW